MHFADMWEAVADEFPHRPASICDGQTLSWREYENRAARLANLMHTHGVTAGAKVGLYLHNSNPFSEAQFAAFKLGGCPINVNYRYKADELVHLLAHADVEVLFYQACYAMRIWEIRKRLPGIRLYVQVSDGTEALMDFAQDYDRSVRDNPPLPRQTRDADGVYMLYTGGTSGLPEAVMYPVGEFARCLLGMGMADQGLVVPLDIPTYVGRLHDIDKPPVTVMGCPMVLGVGMWLGGFVPHILGGTVVCTARQGLDADRLLDLVETYRATDLVIVGDAFARPVLAALDSAAQRGTPYDISSLRQISSSGAMWSQATKQGLLRHHDMILADIMGASEGSMGTSITTREGGSQTATFEMGEGVVVFNDHDHPVQPGSGEAGSIATSAIVPLGFYKDAQKSARTFREIDGVRYSFPGDYATVASDGSMTLLGRGSGCIHTDGETVFAEEVEEALKTHGDVADCLVVGITDERLGEQVVAVLGANEGCSIVIEELLAHVQVLLASYKLPRRIVVVEQVRRPANGKADYKWARQQASAAFASVR